MYIWMIIAVFVTTLFAFNLHVRPDAKSLYADSQAETVAAKVTIWHDALRDSLKMAYDNSIKDTYHGSHYINLEYKPEIGSDNKFTINGANSSNTLTTDILLHMRLPLAEVLPGTKSKTFCVDDTIASDENFFKRKKNGIETICQNAAGGNNKLSCCDGEGIYTDAETGQSTATRPGLYLITLAPVPIKWQKRDDKGQATGLPNNELIHGLHHVSGKFYNGTDRLGYLVKEGDNKYTINSFGKDAVELSKSIIKLETTEGDFLDTCKNDEGKDVACIVYMSKINIKKNTSE